MADREHNFLREGAIAGFLGATSIAIWFLVVDAIAGRAFYTPAVLGQGLANVLGKTVMGDSSLAHVAGYTVFHYAIFILVGILLTVIVHQAARTPAILAGLLIVVVAFELGFYMLTALFTESPLGDLAWWQIFVANLLAAVVMFAFLWNRHPQLGLELRQALEGTDA